MDFRIPSYGGARELSAVNVGSTVKRLTHPQSATGLAREWSSVMLTNRHATGVVYLKVRNFKPDPTTGPTISSNDFHIKLDAGKNIILPFNQSVEVWGFTNEVGGVDVNIVELL